MDSKNIIQQGEEVKYQITINRIGFLMNEDNFRVRLTWGMLGKELIINKDQMIANEADEWFFMFSTEDMVGRVKAECQFDVPDSDYEDGFRTEVDIQCLCVVITHPLPARICVPVGGGDDRTVVYERTDESDVAELYATLYDRTGTQIVTADNENIMVLKREYQ